MSQTPRTSPSDLFRQASALHRSGHFREALNLYDRVLQSYPNSAEILTYCGAALIEIGEFRMAIERLTRAVAVKPNHIDARNCLGNALQGAGRWGEAEAVYHDALLIASRDARLHHNLGVLLHARGRLEEAAQCFRRAIEADPDYAEAYKNLSQTYLELGEAGPALEAGETAIAIDPSYAAGQNAVGNALIRRGRDEEAIEAYRRAIEIRPDFVDALNNLGIALVVEGQPETAVETTEACLDVDPANVTALATQSVALNEAGETERLSALVDFDNLLRPIRIEPEPPFDDIDAFNAALAQHVRTHPTLHWAPKHHATRNGRHSGNLLAEPKGPVAHLEAGIEKSFRQYLEELPEDLDHPFLAGRPDGWELDMWALVLERQGYQVPHIHPTGWLSGCYYVEVDEAVSSEDDGSEGWIEFGRPQDIYQARQPPRVELVRPEEGLMVLFPSFFFHRTIPFAAETERICVAFDIRPTG